MVLTVQPFLVALSLRGKHNIVKWIMHYVQCITTWYMSRQLKYRSKPRKLQWLRKQQSRCHGRYKNVNNCSRHALKLNQQAMPEYHF